MKSNKVDPRLSDLISPSTLDAVLQQETSFIIQGYPDDTAITQGGGRAGSAQGPAHIRAELAKLTPHVLHVRDCTVFDIGDVAGASIDERHLTAQKRVTKLLKKNHRVITLGGGHDYGFPDGAAFLDVFSDRPLVLNLDAHLDVRDLSRGVTSGTPFFRLLEQNVAFDFAEIGIQSHCNSRAHFDYANKKGARILSFDEWLMSGESLTTFVLNRLEPWLVKKRPTFLSLDIDAIAASAAPGCSAPQPLGLPAHDVLALLQVLFARLDIRLFGVYETSPPLDLHNLTSKLAAQLIQRFLYSGDHV